MQIAIEARKIYIASKSVDFRKGTNGLCALIASELNGKPELGVYVFYNKDRNRLKILGWHGNGFILLYKRLEKGKFVINALDEARLEITEQQLNWLLGGFDWELLSNWNNPKIHAYF